MNYQTISTLVEMGMSFNAIAKELNCSPGKVIKFAAVNGIKSQYQTGAPSKVDPDIMIQMYNDGYTQAAIARHFNVSPVAIHKRIRKMSEFSQARSDFLRLNGIRKHVVERADFFSLLDEPTQKKAHQLRLLYIMKWFEKHDIRDDEINQIKSRYR